MKEKSIITIPTPCSENWDNMTPEDKGRFCASCQKTVIDFSALTDAQVLDTFKAAGNAHICGRFHTSQLGREMVKHTPHIAFLPSFISKIAASFLFFQTIITAAIAQNVKPKTTQHTKPAVKSKPPAQKFRGIKGHIKDNFTGMPLPGMTVRIAGTGIADVTDKTGKFALPIPDIFLPAKITLHVDTPYTAGTFIPDQEMSIDSALTIKDVVLYRYPLEKLQPQAVISYAPSSIVTHSMGGSMRQEIITIPTSIKRWSIFRRIAWHFTKKHKH